MNIKKVAVLGAGAVGSYVIWGLSARRDIELGVVADGPRGERLVKEGCAINGKVYRPAVWTPQEAHDADLLIVCLKYGALPGEVNPEVRALAGIDPEAVITCRPADNIAPELETYKEQFKDIAKSEEDVLSLALFPQVAPKFLAWRDGPHEAPAQPAEAPKAPPAGPNAVRELFVEYKF